MSSATIGKRPTTPKKQRSRSQSQQKDHVKENIPVQTSLPPSVEGPVYAILICHIPKLRWLIKYQSLCRSAIVKVTWWGENDTSAIFKPQISGTSPDYRQQPNITAKYYIRSELQQFSKYLTDAVELVLKVVDSDTNRIFGTVKIQNLSTLSISNSIKGYHPIFSSKGDKLGELFVSLRLYLPGPQGSNENLVALSFTSETSNPPSRRNSIGASDYNQGGQLENGLRTYTLDRPYNAEYVNSVQSSDSTASLQAHRTNSKNTASGMQAYKELPTGKVVEELIERANRLRENMIKLSSSKTTTTKKKKHIHESISFNSNNYANTYTNKSLDMLVDAIDPLADNENLCDLLGIKSTVNLNDSNNSILTDLDGLENEQSLLDDLLYGENAENDRIRDNKKRNMSSSNTNKKRHSNSKLPTGRSRSPSMTRLSTSSNRSRSATRNRSLTRSNDSDTASRISYDTHNSEIDDSGNETHNEDELSSERIQLLNHVRIARIRIDHLRLNILNGRESPSHSSFGRTNKSKRALTYYIEYEFPVTINNHNGHINEATEVMKISSKRFELNNDIIFSHLSTYSCLFNQTNLKTWWRSLLIFKIYSRMSGTTSPEQIAFAVLPLRNILKANYLHFEQDLNLIDRTQMNTDEKIPNKIAKKFCIEFLINESSVEVTDGLVVQVYLSIVEARNIPSISSQNNQPRNPYFVCRAFWNEEPISSVVCWGSSTPKFNFEQKIPLLLTKSMIEKMHQNFVIIELWDKKISSPSDQLIGIIKIPLEQFFVSFKDKQISRVLLRAQYPVISIDSWLPIIDPFTSTTKSTGEIQVLLAMGTADQITAVQIAHAGGDLYPSLTNKQISSISNNNSSSLIEHYFEIMIESINGLRAFESMIWGESDCFIQYLFPTQHEEHIINPNSIKPFQLRTICTTTSLCTSDPTFHDTNKFRYILSPADALHKYFYAACQSTTPIDASIQFEVWSRSYYPNIRDQLLAKGKLPAAKLCSMTTMLNADNDDKSLQSFRVPLEIVREDSKHEQDHYSSTTTYGGDLLLTITYKRNIVKQNESQTISRHLSTNDSQVCIIVDIIRACGLKYATQFQAQHDTRFNYSSQVGVNTYAKITISFLSDLESRTTRTIFRSFIPEYNYSIEFPVSLIWNDHRNQSISLAEMLEHGELKIDIYHQMNSNNKQSLDILLCYCKIPLKELIIKHTGIKGWYPLSNVNNNIISEISSNSIEHCVGGIELSIHFSEQDDRRRIIDSAKKLGWFDENFNNEENFLDNNQTNHGCLVKLSIDRIEIPLQLLTQIDKDRINIFAQYRFYDKMPIITKRKKPIIERNHLVCKLDFNKEHFFLINQPFLWYLREEIFEIQIWISENNIYDYSQSLISTTDKLIGSIYIDLNFFLNKTKEKFNQILPIFKQGIKDLYGAYVQIQLTMDKSKNFNELKNENNIELNSYLEKNYLNFINNNHALRTITNNIFSILIHIEQGTHLPNIYSQHENLHKPPNTYITYSTDDSNQFYSTQVIKSTTKPQWNYQQIIHLSIEYLFNEKKLFILKIWHKIHEDIEINSNSLEKSDDKVLGFVSIDLSPLLSGLQQISGWYNIIDMTGNIQGQIKINLIPQEDLLPLKSMKSNQSKLDSYRSISTINENNLSIRSNNTDQTSLYSTIINDENNKPSYLMNNLRRQLDELDIITERLKSRYSSSCSSNSEISSTLTMNSNRIEKQLFEHISESLINNNLNETDRISLYNDQVHLAQELMIKANSLLETSKDFFIQPLSNLNTRNNSPEMNSNLFEEKR